jgi:hypothetical protein
MQKRKRSPRELDRTAAPVKGGADGRTHLPLPKRAKLDAPPSHFDALPEEMVERMLDLAAGPDRTDDCELLLTRVACRMVCKLWRRIVRPTLPHLALLPRALAAGLPNLFDWTLSMAEPYRELDESSPDSLRGELLLWACADDSMASIEWTAAHAGTRFIDKGPQRSYLRKFLLVALSRGNLRVLDWLRAHYKSGTSLGFLFEGVGASNVIEAISLVPDPQRAIRTFEWVKCEWGFGIFLRSEEISELLLRSRTLGVFEWWLKNDPKALQEFATIGWDSIVRHDHTRSDLLSLSGLFPSPSRPADEIDEKLRCARLKAAPHLLLWLECDGSVPARGGPPNLATLLEEAPPVQLAEGLESAASAGSVGALALLAKMRGTSFFVNLNRFSICELLKLLQSFGDVATENGTPVFCQGRSIEIAKRIGIPYARSMCLGSPFCSYVGEMRDILASHGSLWTERELTTQLAYSPQQDRPTIELIVRIDEQLRCRIWPSSSRSLAMRVATMVQDTELMAHMQDGLDGLGEFVRLAATERRWRALEWMLDNRCPAKASDLAVGVTHAALDAESDLAMRLLSFIPEGEKWLTPSLLQAVCGGEMHHEQQPSELLKRILARSDFAASFQRICHQFFNCSCIVSDEGDAVSESEDESESESESEDDTTSSSSSTSASDSDADL